MNRRGLPLDDPLRQLPQSELDDLLDEIIDSWPSSGLTPESHLGLEIAYAQHRGHQSDGMPPAAELAEAVADYPPALRRFALETLMSEPSLVRATTPVPGCRCERCTGITAKPAPDPKTFDGWQRKVERARSVSIVDVLTRLGCEPHPKGRGWVASCPLHDDKHPSLSVDHNRGWWYCFPCAEGGDGIKLWMRTGRLSFAQAVREIVP